MKYSRKSMRLPNYDYSQENIYFVTICADQRAQVLGEIENGEIVLNDIGKIINDYWEELPQRFANIEMGEYVIMPNHLHGIINIVGARFSRPDNNINENIKGRENPAPTLGQIIAYYKYQTTKQINIIQNNPIIKFWQRNYYEYVVRDEKDLSRIRDYILTNPLTWKEDKYY